MRILILSLAGIGDTLIATPFLRELRGNLPDARIDVLTMWPGSKSILEGNPRIDRVFQHFFIGESKAASLKFLLRLRRERYDLSINTHPQGRREYRLIARIIGADRRLSHRYENDSAVDRLLAPESIPQDYTVHSVENNRRLLALLGFPTTAEAPSRYEIFIGEPERRWAGDFIRKERLEGVPFIGMHVGSGGTKNLRLKRWPLHRYEELIGRILREIPAARVLLLGGPEERADHRRLLDTFPSGGVIAPETPGMRHAAALIERCPAFLSVDTALMHIAAAVGVRRQYVIEAPTLNPTNLPFGNRRHIIPNPAVAGRNLDYYRYDGRPIQGSDEEIRRLMESVSVDDVFRAVAPGLASP